MDPFKPAPKISLLTTSSNPPIDVASTLSSAGGEKHKRDIASAGAGPMLSVSAQTNGKKQSIAPPGFNPSKKDKKNEKEPTIEKEDLVIFPELQVIIDGLLSGIVSSADHSTLDVDKNLKRKVEQGEKGEQEVEFMSPLFKLILDNEEASLKYRLERLASHLQQQLRHLRAKGLETYVLLDEWITARFQSEIDAIKILSNVVCDAVECETRLPNALSIVGDVFKIDFEVLTFELDAAPRPESPVEKSEGFTVLQLCNLSRQFALVAPNGWISCREFVDSVSRMRDLSV